MLRQPNLSKLKRFIRSEGYGLCDEEIAVANAGILVDNTTCTKACGEYEAQNFAVAGLRDAVALTGVTPRRFIRNVVIRAAIEEMISAALKDKLLIQLQGYVKRGESSDLVWEFNPDASWTDHLLVINADDLFYVMSKLNIKNHVQKPGGWRGGRLAIRFIRITKNWELLGSVEFGPNESCVLIGSVSSAISPYVERANHILKALDASCATDPRDASEASETSPKRRRMPVEDEESKEEGEL